MKSKLDLSNEKWILLHKIPREDILEFILNHEFEYFWDALSKKFYTIRTSEIKELDQYFGEIEE